MAMDERKWPSQPPIDCPFEPSKEIVGLIFTGRHVAYTEADTWYPSWAADDTMYSPWTDGNVSQLRGEGAPLSEIECSSDSRNPVNAGRGGKSGTGQARIIVDFGKELQYSPDGKAYLVGHGASRPDANLGWIAGDQAYLIRVTPSLQSMNDASKYEFFGGHTTQGEPIWTSDFSRIKPLIEWNGRVGHATMTYHPALKKYLLCVTDGWPTISTMNTYILESDTIAGPWKLVTFMEKFGAQGYFVNIPSKFISSSGTSMWLCYSANFTNPYLGTNFPADPPGSKYAMCLQEIELDAV